MDIAKTFDLCCAFKNRTCTVFSSNPNPFDPTGSKNVECICLFKIIILLELLIRLNITHTCLLLEKNKTVQFFYNKIIFLIQNIAN